MVGESKEVELILTRLSLFLEGKWCASMTEETGDKDCTLAEEEMNDWFAAGEQVRVCAMVCIAFSRCDATSVPVLPTVEKRAE